MKRGDVVLVVWMRKPWARSTGHFLSCSALRERLNLGM